MIALKSGGAYFFCVGCAFWASGAEICDKKRARAEAETVQKIML
jgi:hypothetical protein